MSEPAISSLNVLHYNQDASSGPSKQNSDLYGLYLFHVSYKRLEFRVIPIQADEYE